MADNSKYGPLILGGYDDIFEKKDDVTLLDINVGPQTILGHSNMDGFTSPGNQCRSTFDGAVALVHSCVGVIQVIKFAFQNVYDSPSLEIIQ